MVTVTATDEVGLDQVSGEVHDCFFDLTDISFDPQVEVLTIPFRRWDAEGKRLLRRRGLVTTWRVPWRRWFLRIHHVLRWEVEDHAQTGEGDFDEITYDKDRHLLVVECGAPIRITVHVAALCVQVEETSECLGFGRFPELWRGRLGTIYSGEVLPE